MEDKKIFRNKILDIRKNLTRTQVKEMSIKVCKKLLSSDLYRQSQSIFCYSAVRNELDLTFFIEKALRDGKSISLPKVLDKKGLMKFYEIHSITGLERGTFGILEPSSQNENIAADIILVPGVVCSKQGDRIGQAGGFYDRFLEKNNIYSVGICYDFQLFDKIPHEKHDKKMNKIISEQREIDII